MSSYTQKLDPLSLYDYKKMGFIQQRPFDWKVDLRPKQDLDIMEKAEKLNRRRKIHLLNHQHKTKALIGKAIEKLIHDP